MYLVRAETGSYAVLDSKFSVNCDLLPRTLFLLSQTELVYGFDNKALENTQKNRGGGYSTSFGNRYFDQKTKAATKCFVMSEGVLPAFISTKKTDRPSKASVWTSGRHNYMTLVNVKGLRKGTSGEHRGIGG